MLLLRFRSSSSGRALFITSPFAARASSAAQVAPSVGTSCTVMGWGNAEEHLDDGSSYTQGGETSYFPNRLREVVGALISLHVWNTLIDNRVARGAVPPFQGTLTLSRRASRAVRPSLARRLRFGRWTSPPCERGMIAPRLFLRPPAPPRRRPAPLPRAAAPRPLLLRRVVSARWTCRS